jgi:endonuclease/exonuclease/phosphatase family metal-dependent hydrolase
MAPIRNLAWLLAGLMMGAFVFRADAEPSNGTFSVVWYNVENWGPTDRWIDGKKEAEAMKPESSQKAVVAMIKRVNPDVLGVCEILQDPRDPEKYAKHFREVLKAGGLDYPHMRTCRGEDVRGSLVLLSRFPIEQFEALNSDTYELNKKTARGEGAPTERVKLRVSRGILHARVRVNAGYAFDLFTAHLKSKRPADSFDDDKTHQRGDNLIRRNEALILRGHVQRVYQAKPDANLLVMGDLNDTQNYPAITTVIGSRGAEVRMHNLPLADWLGDRWTHYYVPNCEYQKIDYMIASTGMAREFIPEKSGVHREREGDGPEYRWRNGADHRMIYATFHASERSEPYAGDPDWRGSGE